MKFIVTIESSCNRVTEELRLAPAVIYPWTFSINAEGLAVKPHTVSDVIEQVLP